VENDVDVLILDPLITIHKAPENDTTAMNMVFKALKHIANKADCAVEVLHHTRKGIRAG
jgi:RecA-family ATPase